VSTWADIDERDDHYLGLAGANVVATEALLALRDNLADVVAAVRRHAPVAAAELVGLAPRAAFEGFPDDVPVPGFDPARHLIEAALAAASPSGA